MKVNGKRAFLLCSSVIGLASSLYSHVSCTRRLLKTFWRGHCYEGEGNFPSATGPHQPHPGLNDTIRFQCLNQLSGQIIHLRHLSHPL